METRLVPNDKVKRASGVQMSRAEQIRNLRIELAEEQECVGKGQRNIVAIQKTLNELETLEKEVTTSQLDNEIAEAEKKLARLKTQRKNLDPPEKPFVSCLPTHDKHGRSYPFIEGNWKHFADGHSERVGADGERISAFE